MNNKNIIIAGAIAIGVYLLSQGKAIFSAAAQKVNISRLPVAQIRYMIAHAAAQKKTGKEVAALKAEEARRVALWKVRHKVASKRIGRPIARATYIAAARKKAAVRKAAAQKIGKKIGKKVAQKVAPKIKALKALRAQHAKRQRPQIQRPRPTKKHIASRLFSGAEKSRIIPYSESSKHSYYGPKSHKLQNEGYRVKSNEKYNNSVEAYDDNRLMDVLQHPWLHKKKVK